MTIRLLPVPLKTILSFDTRAAFDELPEAVSAVAGVSASLTENGMRISGRSPDGKFVEIAELPNHPWFLAVQFHPEFQSRPLKAHPLFASFVEAAYQSKLAEAGQQTIAKGKA